MDASIVRMPSWTPHRQFAREAGGGLVKALVLNALGRGFDFEDVDIVNDGYTALKAESLTRVVVTSF